MPFVGADADALDGLASQVTSAADQLESIRNRVRGSLGSSPWDGPDASTFRTMWAQTHAATLTAATAGLRETGEILRRNAQEQRTASDARGGGGSIAIVGIAAASVAGSVSKLSPTISAPTYAPDRNGNYYKSWDLGTTKGPRGPEETLWWLTNRTDYEFPFTFYHLPGQYTVHSIGTISDVGDATRENQAGQNYALSGPLGLGRMPIHVDFAGMKDGVAVLEFTALPGHAEGAGSHIRFSSWISADGHQHFDVTGHDTFNYDDVPASWLFGDSWKGAAWLADQSQVESMWNQLAAHVNGGSYPGG